MRLHTVIVTRDRLDFLKATVNSYLDTVTVPFELVVVDNHSGAEAAEWLMQSGLTVLRLPANRYPGYAANRGFRLADERATHLHRSDNDMRFLPGWCEWLSTEFDAGTLVGQVSLRTDEQEPASDAVGGNMVLARAAWDEGVRYTDEPWDAVPWEDGLLTANLVERGWLWRRVRRACTIHLGDPPDFTDAYYRDTYAIRGLPVPD